MNFIIQVMTGIQVPLNYCPACGSPIVNYPPVTTEPGQTRQGISTLSESSLYAQSHDGVDYVIIILFQRLDSLVPRDTSLGHDQLDIFILQSRCVDLFSVVFFLFLLGITSINGFALAMVVGMVMSSVVVSGMIVCLLGRQLLSGGDLRLRVEILNLSFSEDAVRTY